MRYDRDILDEFAESKKPTRYPTVEVSPGMVVEDRSSGFVGDVVRWNYEAVTLRDRNQYLRHFTWKPGGFLLEGKPVTLTRPAQQASATQQVTASGSIAADRSAGARVAKASRIWVEGKHDAELLEHVWGDDLRELGIVVEPLHGADDLAAAVAEFCPGGQRRLGVLLDHLVAGSKESRIAATVDHPSVLITGHPFVDVWAGIRPKVMGLQAWPDVPKGQPWKEGMCCGARGAVRGVLAAPAQSGQDLRRSRTRTGRRRRAPDRLRRRGLSAAECGGCVDVSRRPAIVLDRAAPPVRRLPRTVVLVR